MKNILCIFPEKNVFRLYSSPSHFGLSYVIGCGDKLFFFFLSDNIRMLWVLIVFEMIVVFFVFVMDKMTSYLELQVCSCYKTVHIF